MKTKPQQSKTRRRTAPQAKARTRKWILRLYVAGWTTKAVTAFHNLKAICEQQLKGRYIIQVIDLLEHPRLAHDHQILAVPTLVRKLPIPMRRIIGDLSDRDRVLVGLDLIDHSALKL